MKKLISFLLVFCILFCGLPFCASATEATESGTVTFTAIDGPETDETNLNYAEQNYTKLLDGRSDTKWCIGIDNDVYVVIKASRSVAVNGYTFTTGNDNASSPLAVGRNPKDWILYGCNDYNETDKTGSWAVVHAVANDTTMQDRNSANYSFSVGNAVEYQYYKLVIKSTRGGDLMQLGEMSFSTAESGWYTPAGGKAISLGTASIPNPVSGSGKWQHVYFGYYNGNIATNILSKSTTEFSEGTSIPTMLLEWVSPDDFEIIFNSNKSSVWANSEAMTALNGTSTGSFLAGFTQEERSAISTAKKTSLGLFDPVDIGRKILNEAPFVPLNSGEKVFILDYKEYCAMEHGFKQYGALEKKTATRTPMNEENIFRSPYKNENLGYYYSHRSMPMNPAFNVKLSSILFTKNVSGNPADYEEVYYKLALLSSGLGVTVTGDAVKTGSKVKIPYIVTGNSATQLSAMILNKPYAEDNSNGAAIKYYAKLADVTTQKSGTAELTVPSEFSGKIPGEDYYIYVVAEDVNGEKATDYASTPVLVTPKFSVTYEPGSLGTGTATTDNKIKDVALTLKGKGVFTRTDYTQIGWSLTDGGNKAFDLGGSYTLNEDIVLYPVWEQNEFIAIDGNGNTYSNEKQKYPMLVDGDENTKWCCSSKSELYIVMKASKSVAVNGYTFTTGDDTGSVEAANGRNPKTWELYGCNDYNETDKTGSWVVLHSVLNDTTMQDKDFTDYSFSFNNAVEYRYYKLVIKASQNGQMMQLAEMKLSTTESGWFSREGYKDISLGTDAILNPVSGKGKWQHVYFGKYNENPIDFRILSKSISDFGTKTMFLENANGLFEDEFDSSENRSSQWDASMLRSKLNGNFLSTAFASGEQAAIHASQKGGEGAFDSVASESDFPALNGDKIFVLALQEYIGVNYGFGALNNSRTNIYKTTDRTDQTRYMTRNLRNNYNTIIRLYGIDNYEYVGLAAESPSQISPALNVKLSSVLFTKSVSGNHAGYEDVYYKLALLSSGLGVTLTGDTVKTGNKVKIPYNVTGSGATQLSAMILNKPYTAGNTNGAVIKYYAKLATVTSQKTGTTDFTIPSEFLAKTPGKDYYIYVIAEDINGEKATDYASTPVLVTPKFSVTYKPGVLGTGTEQTVNKTLDTPLTLLGETFTRTAYTQVGWAESEGGAKKYDLGASYTAEKDIVLYPVWEEKIYTINVTYDGLADTGSITLSGGWDTAVLNGFTPPTYTDGVHSLKYLGLLCNGTEITESTNFKDIVKDASKSSVAVTLTIKWEYNVQDAAGLLWAVQNRITNIVLKSDITLSSDLDFSGNGAKTCLLTTLDLNGYALTGNGKIKLLKSDLLLTDSRPNAAHNDYTLPLGGVIGEGISIDVRTSEALGWPDSTVYANGGTVMGCVELASTYHSFIKNTANAVTVFAGQVKAYSNIDGGIYLKTVEIVSGSDKYITKGIFYGGLTDESRIDPNSKVITVSFDLTGAQGNISKQIFVGVDSYKAIEPESTPTAAGKAFMLWKRSNGELFDFENEIITENTVLYPCWESAVSTAAELKSAVEAGDYSIVLGADIALDSDVVFGAGTKYFDLNGHILSGGSSESIKIKLQYGDITLNDSAPETAHTDTALPEGGIIDGLEIEISCGESVSSTVLYANGGTVTGTVSISNASASIVSNGGTPTSFRGAVKNTLGTISGGKYFAAVENSSKITGGSFFGGIIAKGDKSSVTGKKFTVNYNSNGGSGVLPQVFVNVLSEKMLAPAAPTRSGYKLAGWSKNGAYFDFNYTVKNNMSLTAIWALPGDANGDGAVDILDLVRIKKYTSGTADCKPENKAATDMNDSGGIDSLDLTLLKKLLLGILN